MGLEPKGEDERARQDFEKALALDPAPELKQKLEAALIAGDKDFQTCDDEQGETAIAACGRAIASGRYSGEVLASLHIDRGYLRIMEGQLDEALADFNEAIGIDPNSVYAHWNRGDVYRKKGELWRARADYEKALSLEPRAEDKPKIAADLTAIDTRKSLSEFSEADRSKMRDPSLMPIAFISHAKTDAKTAQNIAAALESRGVACWIAPRDVEPGAISATRASEGSRRAAPSFSCSPRPQRLGLRGEGVRHRRRQEEDGVPDPHRGGLLARDLR